MNDNHNQDEALRKALQQIYINIEIPDSTDSWLNVRRRLNKRRRRKRWQRKMKIITPIVICSCIVGIITSTPLTMAQSHISSFFKRFQTNVIEFFHEKPNQDQFGAKTPPPIDDRVTISKSSKAIEVSLEEARSMVPFDLLVPNEIPDRFQLETIRIFEENGQYLHVQYEYVNQHGEVINIIQRKLEGDYAGLKVNMATGSGEYKEVFINGNSAILLTPFEGNTNLEWLTEDRILVRISGKLDEAEMMNLAVSLK